MPRVILSIHFGEFVFSNITVFPELVGGHVSCLSLPTWQFELRSLEANRLHWIYGH